MPRLARLLALILGAALLLACAGEVGPTGPAGAHGEEGQRGPTALPPSDSQLLSLIEDVVKSRLDDLRGELGESGPEGPKGEKGRPW